MNRFLCQAVRLAGCAAGVGAAGTTAFAFAEPTSTPGKSGEYHVERANGGYEVGYRGRAGEQVVEIYEKAGPAVYVGPPNASPAAPAAPAAAAATTKSIGNDIGFDELQQRLGAINTAAVADADKEGLRVMDGRLRPLRKGLSFVGRARTVKCHNDFLTVIKALSESEPGDVLVIDTQGSNRTVAGELFGTESMRRGIQAIVMDGPCRDTGPLSEMDIPVFCTGVRPISGTACKIYETQVPVMCGGVVVHPGDIVFGDDDGIIVASIEHMARILPAAENVVAAEDALLKGMKSGVSLLDMLNFADHYDAIKSGDTTSKLQFKGATEIA